MDARARWRSWAGLRCANHAPNVVVPSGGTPALPRRAVPPGTSGRARQPGRSPRGERRSGQPAESGAPMRRRWPAGAPCGRAPSGPRFGVSRRTASSPSRALIANDPQARHLHRRWHAGKVEVWLEAVRRPPGEAAAAVARRPTPTSPAGAAVDWDAVARDIKPERAPKRRKRPTTGKKG